MADIIEARVPADTHTNERGWEDTETRKQAVGTKLTGQLKFSKQNMRASQVGVFTVASGAKEYGIAPSGVQALAIASPQDQAAATSETPDMYLVDHLMQAICAIAPGVSHIASIVPETIARLWSCDESIVRARVASSASTQVDYRYRCFRNRLVAALADEPIEDGVTHRAEQVIDEALRTNSSECRDWLSQTLAEHYQQRPSVGASIVRCIGRVDYEQVGQWGVRVMDDALRHKDVEMREAAIRGLEAWGGPEALGTLRRHRDSVAWLNEYVSQVIVDLSGITS